ncbi:MAG: signal transduction protein eal-ggdef domain, partial [Ilumatobacteraceae bacterium]|nr:signal transduction protein eal-ggdef domain [Ilumatobacteraceae bacterium]
FYAGASLHGSSGHNYGALCVMDVVPRTLDDIQRAGLARLARRATVLIDIRRQTKDAQRSSIQLEVAAADFAALEQNHKRDATIDTLTGLANRASLLDTLEITIKLSGDDDRVTLFLCDVDHFATVNDTVGHVIGDQVLREVAARIDECVRSTESVGRLGDDQFAVVMGSCESSTIDALANRIMQRVAKPMTLPSGEHFVPSVSIGVASGRHGQDADSLMRSGRAALSAAKQRGGGQVHVMGVDEVPGDTLAV